MPFCFSKKRDFVKYIMKGNFLMVSTIVDAQSGKVVSKAPQLILIITYGIVGFQPAPGRSP